MGHSGQVFHPDDKITGYFTAQTLAKSNVSVIATIMCRPRHTGIAFLCFLVSLWWLMFELDPG